jgi:hypothetical protein
MRHCCDLEGAEDSRVIWMGAQGFSTLYRGEHEGSCGAEGGGVVARWMTLQRIRP